MQRAFLKWTRGKQFLAQKILANQQAQELKNNELLSLAEQARQDKEEADLFKKRLSELPPHSNPPPAGADNGKEENPEISDPEDELRVLMGVSVENSSQSKVATYQFMDSARDAATLKMMQDEILKNEKLRAKFLKGVKASIQVASEKIHQQYSRVENLKKEVNVVDDIL